MFKQLCGDKFCQSWFPLPGRKFSEKENNNLISLLVVNYREQILHILTIQRTINNLNFHVDCLVQKGVVFSPCFIKLILFKTLSWRKTIILKTAFIALLSKISD